MLAPPEDRARCVTMPLRVFLAAVALALMPSAVSACSERPEGSRSYESAVRRVLQLPEVKAWRELIAQHPRFKAIHLPDVDHQSLIGGRCYWSVTLYSAEGTHLHRWHTFYVRLAEKEILVDDITGGEPLSLAEWRRRPAR